MTNETNKKIGRPRLFQAVQQKLAITLPAHYARAIRELGKDKLGKGNLSRGVRLLWEYYRKQKEVTP